MKPSDLDDDLRKDAEEAVALFESIVGASEIEAEVEQIGTQLWLKLVVGRTAPVYDFALHELRHRLRSNAFEGLIGLTFRWTDRFPASVEASALAILLARATRPVAQGATPEGFAVPYVPFQNREDHKVAQPATQLIVGRRGVGKSTLVMRARQLLAGGRDVSTVLDMQAYSELAGPSLYREVLLDVFCGIRESVAEVAKQQRLTPSLTGTETAIERLNSLEFDVVGSMPMLRRSLADLTRSTEGQVYVFLDDFHLVVPTEQPMLLQLLHGVVKGANGWLKVAGLRSLLNHYDPATRKGLQIPGDAQLISLDLTLENPQAAERHLAAILSTFMSAVGYSTYSSILSTAAFRRLVWANAGVPRDFLQMFARSLEHAGKARNANVTLGDINIAIGEFGQRKVDEMQEDARNEQGLLRRVVDFLLNFCLEDRNSKVNAFLVRAAASRERSVIATLSDLRLLHLIHQSITPDRAGETYQAYILDYSLFTGFRRKRNVTEMLPDEGEQFKATALRQLPKLPTDFLRDVEPSSSGTVDSPARGEEADDRAKPLVPSTGAPQARRRRRTTGASRKSARKRTKTAKGSAKQAGKKK